MTSRHTQEMAPARLVTRPAGSVDPDASSWIADADVVARCCGPAMTALRAGFVTRPMVTEAVAGTTPDVDDVTVTTKVYEVPTVSELAATRSTRGSATVMAPGMAAPPASVQAYERLPSEMSPHPSTVASAATENSSSTEWLVNRTEP